MKYLYAILLLTLLFTGSSFFAGEADHTGITTVNSKIKTVYPNPATSYIIFEFDKQVDMSYSLHIFTFFGKKMAEIRISDSKLNINLDDSYSRGLYIYQLRDQTGKIIESGKFQVNK